MVVKQDLFEGRVEASKGKSTIALATSRQNNSQSRPRRYPVVGFEFRAGGDDVCRATNNPELPVMDKPGKPDAPANKYDKIEWSGKMKT